mmetsp:Transcript_88566/g.271108  ORF Transcript_88566/g.271108 Transcript_88566/m.271108 type:complete len:358 (-) Transcript_88566:109-1182(-)
MTAFDPPRTRERRPRSMCTMIAVLSRRTCEGPNDGVRPLNLTDGSALADALESEHHRLCVQQHLPSRTRPPSGYLEEVECRSEVPGLDLAVDERGVDDASAFGGRLRGVLELLERRDGQAFQLGAQEFSGLNALATAETTTSQMLAGREVVLGAQHVQLMGGVERVADVEASECHDGRAVGDRTHSHYCPRLGLSFRRDLEKPLTILRMNGGTALVAESAVRGVSVQDAVQDDVVGVGQAVEPLVRLAGPVGHETAIEHHLWHVAKFKFFGEGLLQHKDGLGHASSVRKTDQVLAMARPTARQGGQRPQGFSLWVGRGAQLPPRKQEVMRRQRRSLRGLDDLQADCQRDHNPCGRHP